MVFLYKLNEKHLLGEYRVEKRLCGNWVVESISRKSGVNRFGVASANPVRKPKSSSVGCEDMERLGFETLKAFGKDVRVLCSLNSDPLRTNG